MAQHFETSDELNRHIATLTPDGTVLLSFSCGKDSIAAWLKLRPVFARIVPVYMYLVPGLEFVERSLAYYEQWFGCRIIRMPHPSLYRMFNGLVFQAPQNCSIVEDAHLPDFDYDDVFRVVKEDLGLSEDTYTAIGVRARDSLNRWASIKKYGAYNETRLTFFPVFDYNKAALNAALKESGVRLPVDYKLFGRSFDGLDYRFIKPIRDTFPADYARIAEYFPLVELELKRQDYRQRHYERLTHAA